MNPNTNSCASDSDDITFNEIQNGAGKLCQKSSLTSNSAGQDLPPVKRQKTSRQLPHPDQFGFDSTTEEDDSYLDFQVHFSILHYRRVQYIIIYTMPC